MKRPWLVAFFFAVLLPLLLLGGGARVSAGEEEAPLPYLVVLDFESAFDEGRLGRQVGQMLRMKSTRRRLFSVDTEIDWEDRRTQMKRPALDAGPETVARAAKEAYGCDALVWGRLTRVHPEFVGKKKTVDKGDHTVTTRDPRGAMLRLEVRALDLRKEPPALVLARMWTLKNEYEIAGKVDEILKALTGRPTPADLEAAHIKHRLVPYGPNLCPGGTMDDLAEGSPGEDWHALFPGWHFPMKKGIEYFPTRVLLSSRDGELQDERIVGHLQYTLSKKVAATTGLFCYTPYISIDPETYYQVSFRLKTEGPSVIMFVKGYRDLPVDGYEETKTLRQEVFKHQKRHHGKKGEWVTLTSEPFLPRSVKPAHMPQFLRVQLYVYHPPGVVAFDDVVVRACRLPEKQKGQAVSPKEKTSDDPHPAD